MSEIWLEFLFFEGNSIWEQKKEKSFTLRYIKLNLYLYFCFFFLDKYRLNYVYRIRTICVPTFYAENKNRRILAYILLRNTVVVGASESCKL